MKITKGGLIRITPASLISYSDSGGNYGGGNPSLQDVIDQIGAGTAPGQFLTVVGGGRGTIAAFAVGSNITLDLANANYFYGTLTANTTISFTGWTNGKDCQISVEVTENGTGGWTPTFNGVSWIGGSTPTHDTTAGSVSLYVFLSRDGGTTIYGALLGQGGSSGSFLEVINGGGGTVQAHGSMGATETIDTANGNYHWGTLNANCTFTFTTIADTAERWFTLELIEDGTGGWSPTFPGSVSWLGGSAPSHTTTAGSTTIYAFFTRNGGTTWIGGQLGGSGSVSYGTSATDVAGASSAGSNSTVSRSNHSHLGVVLITSNSSNSLLRPIVNLASGSGISHSVSSNTLTISAALTTVEMEAAPHWELVMQDGVTAPPEPLENEARDDWIYGLVP